MSESIISRKSYQLALNVVKRYKILIGERHEYVLSRQFVRSGTSIGANVCEAMSAQSKRDFVLKLRIGLKEARETLYWIKLLRDSEYLPEDSFVQLNEECNELTKIISSIILTTKQKYFKVFSPTHNL